MSYTNHNRVIYSCVVEGQERYYLQAYLWAQSLITNGGVSPRDIVLQFVEDRLLRRDSFFELGVHIKYVSRFGDGRYCNKASQIDNLEQMEAEFFVLMDCDMFVGDEIKGIFKKNAIGGKVVDAANPLITVLDDLYMQASFIARPLTIRADLEKYNTTYISNLNGGLYVIPRELIKSIGLLWKKWILWILDHPNILDQARKLHHTDQVAFCMAITESNTSVNMLGRRFNFPCHLFNEEDMRPVVYHYHHLLADDGIENVNTHLPLYSFGLESSNMQIRKWIANFKGQ